MTVDFPGGQFCADSSQSTFVLGIAVIESTRKHKVKLLFGLRMSNDPSVFATQTNHLESYLRKRPSLSHLIGISVGNEVLFANMMPESDLIARIKQIRKLLDKYGYKKVKLTTSDVITKYSKRLVDNVDFVVMNLHTYYAGEDVKAAANRILPNLIRKAKSISGKKQLIIGETGWPSGGARINNAIPSLSNLEYYAAKTSCIANRLKVRYFYFEAFNANWKSQGGIEHNWGTLQNKAL
ncbi:glycoside hydrolase superfamily [Paraphysoderma sedebokerense]|nr:glycoside hydrolase superfamily [Paraphysoderma sedebokerense]